MDLQRILFFVQMILANACTKKELADCRNWNQYRPESGVFPFVQK
jgi:hypothetical protein